MKNLAQDLRYALRQLRKSPGFTLTAVLTLALGIGATTAIFSIVDGVLLKPLDYRDSGRLVVVWERVRYLEKFSTYTGANPRHYQMWQKQSTVFKDLTLLQFGFGGVALGNEHPRFVGRVITQPNLLDTLGIQPILGRNFLHEESVQGKGNVVLISWRLWQNLFEGDPNVIGRSLQLGGAPRQVVGVLPQRFYFPKATELSPSPISQQMPEIDVISPLTIDLNGFGWNSDYGNYVALGRLGDGVSVAQAQSQLDTIANDIVRQMPVNELDGDPKNSLSTYVQPLKEVIVGRTSRSLWLLFAAVLSVLLIACVNLANAQLARVVARDREAALRSALGASAWSLVQSSLAEVFILSLVGGALGILLAKLAVDHVASFARIAIPRTDTISVNPGVLALSILLTVGATVLFGLLPALRFLRIRPQQALQGIGRSSGSRRSYLLRRWLIGGQVFACTTLLLVTGLFARSLIHILSSDRGFSTSHVVIATVPLQGKAFTEDKRSNFDDGVLDKLRALPGVESASMVSAMLLQGESWIDGVIRLDQPKKEHTLANYRWISPGYFTTLQQHMIEGRDLDARDRTQKNAVISQTTANAVWPNQSALGRQFKRNETLYTVVGVVADARNNSLRAAPVNMVYLPYWDMPPYGTFFLVRSTQDTALLADAVRKAIWSYNPEVTIADIRTLDSQVNDSLSRERMETMLLAAFGSAAFLLALLGIYGTLTYSVEARTQEIGVRMALGATRNNVYLVTLKEVVAPIGIGLGLGWLASVGVGKSIAALLYGSAAVNALVSIAVIFTFAFAAIVATFLPCRRAASIEPMEALRAE
ncbi:ABC transporter permease [Granulicella sp. dw_53]|uniref:ABC transporter permease n=1 Tax=Granulicella sp. dw_53 TaxID=2719792 RepID=UPI001BD4C064|nr:ABC transporter permease [Granulicella sp. dw_53]